MKNKIWFRILFFLILLFSITINAFAHPGRTDSNGGHYNRKTGEYHYHNGGGSSSKTTKSSSGLSSSSKSSNSSYSVTKEPVYATKITVPNMPSNVSVGENITLNGSVYPENAEDKTISWESSDESVAVIDSNGNLTAVGVGNVVISAKTSRGTTTKFDITVNEIVAESIEIEGKKEELLIGEETLLSVKILPENTTYKDFELKSDNESIVSVDENGKLSALSVGKTTVTATHKELIDSFEIEVKPILAESIEIFCINNDTGEKYNELRFEEGMKLSLEALVLPENTTDDTVVWKVDNSNIADIDKNGSLTALSEGTVTVSAETTNGINNSIEIEIYKTSQIINIIAGLITFIICAGIIGLPIFLIVFIIKKCNGRKK